MAEEEKKEAPAVEEEAEKLSFKTADDLTTFLMDLQGQVGNMQQTIDKLAPVEEAGTEETAPEEEKTDEEVNEIDNLLQGN